MHLLFISTASEAGTTSNPRNLIIAGKNSQVTVLESYVSTADAPYFTNAVTDLLLDEGAVVEHAKVRVDRNRHKVSLQRTLCLARAALVAKHAFIRRIAAIPTLDHRRHLR